MFYDGNSKNAIKILKFRLSFAQYNKRRYIDFPYGKYWTNAYGKLIFIFRLPENHLSKAKKD
ncbi:MAG: hypothetical protein IJM09_03440 [Neisseriaceae bacterium]|nr:hypothetical protein [Neisseriaceae bacterium]